MRKTMLFGPIGRQVELPYPESGMSAVGVLESEETTLLSGGLSVWRAPTTFKTYNMSWKGGTRGLHKNLQPLIDMHAGVYGRGPYYFTDPLAVEDNLLPTRWASSWQLAHVAGSWGTPAVTAQNSTPEGQQAGFVFRSTTPLEGPSLVVPSIPGKPLYLKVWGTATGSAGVRVERFRTATAAWENAGMYTPQLSGHHFMSAISSIEGVDNLFSAVRLTLVKGSAANATGELTLAHMELSVNQSEGFRMGKGVGAVQFTGNAAGVIDSALLDRIGLSIDVKEVQRDPGI